MFKYLLQIFNYFFTNISANFGIPYFLEQRFLLNNGAPWIVVSSDSWSEQNCTVSKNSSFNLNLKCFINFIWLYKCLRINNTLNKCRLSYYQLTLVINFSYQSYY